MKVNLKIKYVVLLCLLLISVMFMLSSGYVFLKYKISDDLDCISKNTVTYDDLEINAEYNFILKGGMGSLKINGEFFSGGRKYPLSRQVHFSYKKLSSVYILTSTGITYPQGDNMIDYNLDGYYPKFFTEKSQQIAFKIIRDTENSSVIYISGVPAFYCVNN